MDHPDFNGLHAKLTSIEDVVQAIVCLIADPPGDQAALRQQVRGLVEQGRRLPRVVPGQELRGYRHELQRMRRARGLTGRQVAAEAGWVTSKVYRIEQGQCGVSVTDMRFLARLYGADEATVRRLVDESRQGWTIGRRLPNRTHAPT
ncbi:helix-turn-helix domain-containing protein [Micromonospora craniellae]|nr:helix-turn-helix transcriptional regulator [Micromonospora craniellae]QOC93989.1 helix-turn-helix domain-containing protein [Micromonospora craniellae]